MSQGLFLFCVCVCAKHAIEKMEKAFPMGSGRWLSCKGPCHQSYLRVRTLGPTGQRRAVLRPPHKLHIQTNSCPLQTVPAGIYPHHVGISSHLLEGEHWGGTELTSQFGTKSLIQNNLKREKFGIGINPLF